MRVHAVNGVTSVTSTRTRHPGARCGRRANATPSTWSSSWRSRQSRRERSGRARRRRSSARYAWSTSTTRPRRSRAATGTTRPVCKGSWRRPGPRAQGERAAAARPCRARSAGDSRTSSKYVVVSHNLTRPHRACARGRARPASAHHHQRPQRRALQPAPLSHPCRPQAARRSSGRRARRRPRR